MKLSKIITFLYIFGAIIYIIGGLNFIHAASVNLQVSLPSGGASSPSAPVSSPGEEPVTPPVLPSEEPVLPPPPPEMPLAEIPPAETPPSILPSEEPATPPSLPGEAPVPPAQPGGGQPSGGGGIGEIVPPYVLAIVNSASDFIKEAGQTIINISLQLIPEPVKQLAQTIVAEVQKIRSNPQVQKIMSKPVVQVSTDAVSAVTAGATATVAVTGIMPFATSVADFASLPIRIFSLIFGVFARKRRKWGIVYDSVSKQPLDPVYVVLKDKNGKELDTKITDMYGRFGFLVPPGEYYIEANKTHYKFPSGKISGPSDELYDHIYHGELLKIDDPNALIINIPMDKEGFDWNEMIKQQDKYIKFNYHLELIKRWLPFASFVFGFILTFAIWILYPTKFNGIMIWFFTILWILRQIGFKEKIWGLILDAKTKKPLPLAIMKVFFENLSQQVHSAAADSRGRYYALVDPGKYDVEISGKKLPDGYESLKKYQGINAKHGVLNKDLFVDKSIT